MRKWHFKRKKKLRLVWRCCQTTVQAFWNLYQPSGISRENLGLGVSHWVEMARLFYYHLSQPLTWDHLEKIIISTQMLQRILKELAEGSCHNLLEQSSWRGIWVVHLCICQAWKNAPDFILNEKEITYLYM